MTLNYLKTSWRSLKKKWPFTLTNILCLSIGIASFLFLMGYTKYEENFDSFHENKDKLFRVVFERYSRDELKTKSQYSVSGIGYRVKDEISEVHKVTRFFQTTNTPIVENIKLKVEVPKLYYVDQDFFSMFSFQVIKGDINSLLSDPNNIVLTKLEANKFFGSEDPIGKELKVTNEFGTKKLTVSGIIKNPPVNTSFDFKILCSIRSLGGKNKEKFQNGWQGWKFPTYIMVKEASDVEIVQKKFPSFVKKYKTSNIEKDISWKFSFQNIKDIRLKSGYDENISGGNKKAKTINILKTIAVLIILISWINYVNLSTASLNERAKEVGVRKSIGAYKTQVIQQFLTEVSIVNVFAALFALGILILIIKYLRKLLHLNYDLEMFSQPIFWIYFLGVLVIGIVLSGIYPALVMSKFKPSEVLKSKNTTTSTSREVRQTLVGIQFLVSILLISSTVIILDQNKFMKSQDLGVGIDDVLLLKKPQIMKTWKFNKTIQSFKNELKKIPSVSNVTSSFATPSIGSWYLSVWRSSGNNDFKDRHIAFGVDEDFIPTYDIKLLAGRNFEKNRKADKEGILISKKSVTTLGFRTPKKALGNKVKVEGFQDKEFNIIGVFDDYRHVSLQNEQLPYTLVQNTGMFRSPRYISIKMANANDIEQVKKVFKKMFPEDLFNYSILKDKYYLQYLPEDRNQNIFLIFSVLTILLASFGVLGMSSYIAFMKNKEIAIRKVFGAEKRDVLWVLSKEFLLVLGSAILLSIPIIYYFMNNWLSNYPYRINIGIWHLALGICIVVLITFLIIRINLSKSLRNRPVKALKTL